MAKSPIVSNDEPAAAAKAPDWYVVDTTAQPDSYVNNLLIPGHRTHEQLIGGRITPFKFKVGEPVAMAGAIARKFLRDPAFIRTDVDGNEVPYERAPKQPEELGAGEKMVLKDNESIARYDELSTAALFDRVAVLPNGEQFAQGDKKPDRAAMIAFIVAIKTAQRKANASKEPERARDEYDPGADELEDAA